MPAGKEPNREHGEDDPIRGQNRDCPRNCERRGLAQDSHWATGKAAPNRQSRKSGDLPRANRVSAHHFEHTEGVPLMTSQRISVASFSLPQRLLGGLSVFLFGSLLIFGVGLSHSDRLHNAAHDTRHAIGFPCH